MVEKERRRKKGGKKGQGSKRKRVNNTLRSTYLARLGTVLLVCLLKLILRSGPSAEQLPASANVSQHIK